MSARAAPAASPARSGLVDCGGTCVDPATSNAHCGAKGLCTGTNAAATDYAGEACLGTEYCRAGVCTAIVSCGSGQIECGAKCVDPQTDPAYCGATTDCLGANAGATCPAGGSCSSGVCVASCTPGYLVCAGTCRAPLNACGNCFTDCAAIFGGRPNAVGVCVTTGAPVCAMVCDPGAFDLNGVPQDGCELVVDPNAIYVSVSDPAADDLAGCGHGPAGTGAGNRPCLSIARGMAEAGAARSKLLVADGLYDESLSVVNGLSLMGGYRPDTWERHLASTLTVVRGTSNGTHRKTVVADGITLATTLEGLIIEGQSNPTPGGNSYALWIRNSNANLVVRNNDIRGGAGGPGSEGAAGLDGLDGSGGTAGQDSIATTQVTQAGCLALAFTPGNQGAAGNGGASTCGATGGNGAGADCPSNNSQQLAGQNGQTSAGAGSAGSGGAGGYDRYSTNCTQFVTGGFSAAGASGGNGGAGPFGGAGAGCPASASAGAVTSSEWVGTVGGPGGTAGNGGGAAGGGAGGGADFTISCGATSDTLGGSAGGGGSGGCAGTAGGGGGAGGGSFGIFVTFSALSTNLPVISNNRITQGQGGSGGRAGGGGVGGLGGSGGAGGLPTGAFAYAMGQGGSGGNGGNGGHGGGGGGGCGGASFGVFVHNAATPPPAYKTGNLFLAGGSGGARWLQRPLARQQRVGGRHGRCRERKLLSQLTPRRPPQPLHPGGGGHLLREAHLRLGVACPDFGGSCVLWASGCAAGVRSPVRTCRRADGEGEPCHVEERGVLRPSRGRGPVAVARRRAGRGRPQGAGARLRRRPLQADHHLGWAGAAGGGEHALARDAARQPAP